MTRLYIAGTNREITPDGNGRLDGLLIAEGGNDVAHRVRILESYRYVQRWQVEHMGRFKGFMLDSGAFTFMHRGMGRTDPDDYVRRYAEFVRDNGVELFFEFDIDKIASHERVLEYRRVIEGTVGRQCIPVWHFSRGPEEWERLCAEYGYVAVGDLGSREMKAMYPQIPRMVERAHELGAVVHGLGCGGATKIRKLPFNSVDSASWTWGHRGHFLFRWDGVGMHYDGFERVWAQPEMYVDILKRYSGAIAPDFSTYADMPYPMQLWNVYRSRALTHYWQEQGIDVIPLIQFSDESSFEWIFDGLPRHSVLETSSVGVYRNPKYREHFEKGMEAACRILRPRDLVWYGHVVNFETYGARIHEYKNDNDVRMRASREQRSKKKG